jgi:hypothetical protein
LGTPQTILKRGDTAPFWAIWFSVIISRNNTRGHIYHSINKCASADDIKDGNREKKTGGTALGISKRFLDSIKRIPTGVLQGPTSSVIGMSSYPQARQLRGHGLRRVLAVVLAIIVEEKDLDILLERGTGRTG